MSFVPPSAPVPSVFSHALSAFADPRANEVLDIIAKETGVERARLVPEATLEELGIPSLDLTQAIFEIESHFDVEIPVVGNTEGNEFATVGGLVHHVLETLDRAHAKNLASGDAGKGHAV